MKIFGNLNPKNEKNIQPRKFTGSQINLVKMSNGDLMVLNEDCSVQNMNEMKMNVK